MNTRVKVKLEFEWDGTHLPFATGDNINEFIVGGALAISPDANGRVLGGAKLTLRYPQSRKTKNGGGEP